MTEVGPRPDHGPHTHEPDDHGHLRHHEHGEGEHKLGLLAKLFHSHQHADLGSDSILESSERGILAVKRSLLILGATALAQVVIALLSGSVGLLADTIHNFADALTAVPLWLAFTLSRRPPNRRYTYGFSRAEDIAGVLIVVIILISAVIALYESLSRLIHPEPIQHLGWVIAAAIFGFLGNEIVARIRLGTGEAIGSAALEADGQHARVNGLTSLSVLAGAVAVAIGVPIADPIVGLLISVAILFILKDVAVTMWHRLMDAVEPDLIDRAAQALVAVPGVKGWHDLRARWLGHRLHLTVHVSVDGHLSTVASHQIAEEVRHALFHAIPRLADVTVHIDPESGGDIDHHQLTIHHSHHHQFGIDGHSSPGRDSRTNLNQS